MEFVRTDDLKEDILRTFEVLVAEHGYDGTTFQMIADILGISKGAITYHFRNKHYIASTLIDEFFTTIREYIDSFPEHYRNQYWRHSLTYIYAYRIILGDPKNERLFFHKNQKELWAHIKVPTVSNIYRTILSDFHITLTDDELKASVYIDLGARNRMYQEYADKNPLFTIDSFCYYHVYLMGTLCRLNIETIRENIAWAFEFADNHEPPTTLIFS